MTKTLSIALLACTLTSQTPAQTIPASGVPAHPSSLAEAHALIDRGHPAEALAKLDLLTAGGTSQPGLARTRGDALYAEGHLPEADAAYLKALTEDSHDHEAEQMRGLTLFRLGRPADAIPLLTASHEWQSGTKVDPTYVLALCYLDTRRYDDARHAFAAQYGLAPDSASAYLLAARMLLRREYVPVAKSFAEKALALDPQLPLAHELLGEIALAGNHLEEALSQLEKERARNPLSGNVYDRLGDAYTRSGDYLQAERSLQRAVLLEPGTTGPYIQLGKVSLKRQDPASAVTYLEHALQMDPANYMTHSLLGQAYRSLGRTEEASRETQTAQRIQAASEPKLESVH